MEVSFLPTFYTDVWKDLDGIQPTVNDHKANCDQGQSRNISQYISHRNDFGIGDRTPKSFHMEFGRRIQRAPGGISWFEYGHKSVLPSPQASHIYRIHHHTASCRCVHYRRQFPHKVLDRDATYAICRMDDKFAHRRDHMCNENSTFGNTLLSAHS